MERLKMLDEDYHNKIHWLKENQIEVDMKVASFENTVETMTE